MKKYTIVYSASTRPTLIEYDRVETEDLAALLRTEKYNCMSWFVFEGWPDTV